MPYVHARLVHALGRVGHASALPTLEEPLRGSDPTAAVDAARAIAEMPPWIALEVFFREHERLEKRKGGASEELKRFIDRVQPEFLRGIQKISGEKYPTMKEFRIWWEKRAPKLREEWAEREKARAAAKPPKGALLPALIVELRFDEGQGTSTSNTGASGTAFPTAAFTRGGKPLWTSHAAPNGGGSALDLTTGAGAWGVDLPAGEHLRGLKSFTICGWAVLRGEPEGASDRLSGAGNRIVSWLAPGQEGVELVFRSDGSLQLGVNEWASAGPARSLPGQFPLLDEVGDNIWGAVWNALRFFAVTYDSTAAADHVKFFTGSRAQDAKRVSTVNYPKGAAGAKIAPQLTVGNVAASIRARAPDRSFRGFLDEIRVYGSPFDGSGALPLEDLILIQNRLTPE